MNRDNGNWQQRAEQEVRAQQQASQQADALRRQQIDQNALLREQESQARQREVERIAASLGIAQKLSEINRTTRFWSGRGIVKNEGGRDGSLSFSLSGNYPHNYRTVLGQGKGNERVGWIPKHTVSTAAGRGFHSEVVKGYYGIVARRIIGIEEQITDVQDRVRFVLDAGGVSIYVDGAGPIRNAASNPNLQEELDKALLNRVMSRLNETPLLQLQADGQKILAQGRALIGTWQKI